MRPVAVVLALLLLCACTPDEHEDTAYAPSPSAAPLPGGSQQPVSQAPSPEITTRPLVLVTSRRRPPMDLPVSVARWILDGTIDNWKDLGQPPAPLRLVERSPIRHLPRNAIAEEVGHAVTPSVRVIAVDGVDPMRDPSGYPLQVQGPPPGPVITLTVVGDVSDARGRLRRRSVQARLAAADLTAGRLHGRPSAAYLADLPLAGFDVRDVDDDARGPAVLRRRGVSFGFLGGARIGAVRQLAGRADVVVVMLRHPVERGAVHRLSRAGADLVVDPLGDFEPDERALEATFWGSQLMAAGVVSYRSGGAVPGAR
jgi:hypothetical protein